MTTPGLDALGAFHGSGMAPRPTPEMGPFVALAFVAASAGRANSPVLPVRAGVAHGFGSMFGGGVRSTTAPGAPGERGDGRDGVTSAGGTFTSKEDSARSPQFDEAS